jgi:hypothetical protein
MDGGAVIVTQKAVHVCTHFGPIFKRYCMTQIFENLVRLFDFRSSPHLWMGKVKHNYYSSLLCGIMRLFLEGGIIHHSIEESAGGGGFEYVLCIGIIENVVVVRNVKLKISIWREKQSSPHILLAAGWTRARRGGEVNFSS